MTPNNFSFPVPNEILEPYIKDAVATAIVGALGDQATIIKSLVASAAGTKVNESGHVSRYSYENKYTIIEAIAKREIEGVVKKSVIEMVKQMRPEIEAEIRRLFREGDAINNISKAVVEGSIDSLSASWAVKFSIGD